MAQSVYNFVGINNPSSTHWCKENHVAGRPPGHPIGGTECTSAEYDKIESSNDVRLQKQNTEEEYHAFEFRFKINEALEDITQLDLLCEGSGSAPSGDGWYLYLWNINTSSWEYLDHTTGSGEVNLTGQKSSNFSYYVDGSGYLYLLAITANTSSCEVDAILRCDYVSVTVTYTACEWEQVHFRVYDDDGGLNAANAHAAEDADVHDIGPGVNFRVRYAVAQNAASTSITRRLEYREDGGAWTQIAAGSGNVRLSLSPHFADGEATSNRLSLDGDSFVAGQGKESGSDTTSAELDADERVEDEWCLQFQPGASGHSYDFRVTDAGTPLDIYTETLTMSAVGWKTVSDIVSYDAEQFADPSIFFEAVLKTSGSYPAQARLYDKTAAAGVAGGQVQTGATSYTRVRSGGLDLADGHEYQVQLGIASGTAMIAGARLIFQ